MKSITLASIVFTLSFCLNLEAEKNLPYKGSPSAGTKHYLVEVEDTENNNGERGTYMFRTKSDLSVGGDVIGGSIQNGKGAKVDIDADYPTIGRSKRSPYKCELCFNNCYSKLCQKIPVKRGSKCVKKCRPKCLSICLEGPSYFDDE